MQAYTGFAYVYDEYMDNIPYEEWCEYLVERLKEQGVTPDMEIADLGCGTGTVTQLLDKAGYSCVGIDNAPDMLTIAAEKLYESGQEIVYSLQDMRDFELPYEVDAMVSIADSMNYITSKEDITSVFECVKKGLKPGGVFIFDLKTIHFFRDVLAENTYAENRDDSAFIWDNYYDEETRNNEYDLAVFIKMKMKALSVTRKIISSMDFIWKKYWKRQKRQAWKLKPSMMHLQPMHRRKTVRGYTTY